MRSNVWEDGNTSSLTLILINIQLSPTFQNKKTGAGNPAPAKRLNLYLSPIET